MSLPRVSGPNYNRMYIREDSWGCASPFVARDGAIRRIRSAEVARMCNADLCGVGLYRAV